MNFKPRTVMETMKPINFLALGCSWSICEVYALSRLVESLKVAYLVMVFPPEP